MTDLACPGGLQQALGFSQALADLAGGLTADSSQEQMQRLDDELLDVLAELPFGQPFTFLEQYGGVLAQDIRPAAGHERESSSRGRDELGLHTDDGFLPPAARPEYIALLGISNPAEVPTHVVNLADVLRLLDDATIKALREVRYFFRNASFDLDAQAVLGVARPILQQCSLGSLQVTLAARTDIVQAHDETAADALRKLRLAAQEARRSSFVLRPGELLIISNTTCLHGRPPVPGERWLKRVYLRRDFGLLESSAATGRHRVYSVKQILGDL